jgi:hypothetical protein
MNLELTELIQARRPNISLSSVRTYRSLLSTLYDTICGSKSNVSFDEFLKKEKDILDELKKYPLARAKTTLSALYIVSNNDAYKRDMLKLCAEDTEQQEKQESTAKQKANWITQEEIKEKYNALAKIALPMLNGKSVPDFLYLNAFMLFCLMSGVFIPPRRVSDYCDMRIGGKFDKTTENWYDAKNGVMHINKYKTAKYYGAYSVDLKTTCPELFNLLKKWLKINKTDYLFFNKEGKPITPSNVVQYNEKIWGKAVSANMYRHSYLTEFFSKGMPSLVQMQELSKAMSHDILTQMKYIKRDAPA